MATAFSPSPIRPAFVDVTDNNANKLRELVHFATLAPSSHNTQCWRFLIKGQEQPTITILPDLKRSCPVVDPDDHHLYVSLGCAVENLVLAARARGFKATVDSSCPKDGIHISLYPGHEPRSSDMNMFESIPKRQVSRCEYDGKPLKQEELDQLEEAGKGKGVRVLLVTERSKMEDILEQILHANTAQMNNPLFKKELGSWIRFNEKEAAKKGDGLYGKSFGNPPAPTILGNIIMSIVARPSTENKKIQKQVQSSAGFAIFVSEHDDPVHWVEVGRSYERFALLATTMGVRNAFLNQPVEEKELRPQFAKMLGLQDSERPDLVVRFGRGPEMPISPRRPVEDVLEGVFG